MVGTVTWASGKEGAMTQQPDHELEVLEEDQTIPPRPEELIADAGPEAGADAGVSGSAGADRDDRLGERDEP